MRDQLRRAAAVTAAAALLALSGAVHSQDQDFQPDRLSGGEPDFNGIWQALNTANWNLEPHSARALDEFWELGSLAAVPPGLGVVEGGEIPYLPEALEQREENRAGWPEADPETKCYLPGIPRAMYMPYPFQIIQAGDGDDLLMAYSYHSANRVIHMTDHRDPPVDTWMGRSNGEWDGDTLVIRTVGFNGEAWLDRAGNFFSPAAVVTERLSLISENVMQYEATIEDPRTFSEPWTIRMPLYRHVEENAQLLEFKCVPFVERLIYKDLILPEDE